MTGSYWNNNGMYQKKYDELYKKLVPLCGSAKTQEGELLRAITNIYYRKFNDGDKIGDYLSEYGGMFKLNDEYNEFLYDQGPRCNSDYDLMMNETIEFILSKLE